MLGINYLYKDKMITNEELSEMKKEIEVFTFLLKLF